MEHYLDLRIRPDPEIAPAHLLGALFTKLHQALVALPDEQIGVSFPEVNEARPWLGELLRLHGNAAALDHLMALPWLHSLRDQVAIGERRPIPADAQYRAVRRVQVDSNPERLRRRLVRRHGISAEQARQRIPDTAGRQLDLPFLRLHSRNSGQRFLLFIRHGPLQAQPSAGRFNRYGLSDSATLPWF
ncbi:type I-F CRISPR-associated endoribonuclease Cas6/Csy4 [Pseudomonas sp. NY15437]|uniref:type I-F CRISPR-associated endoribonuclease Cas6/Csy4 n=1 Tax=Pseudomonas sp. NY15437 TaxID=3400360 RepID=UPI003A8A57A2